ncbi:unnamed protein product [Mytilus edulis]|uniref:Ig-like domain-containing protein n=1 Tax=Mytilus edulis TaxID=6550 RepID=A0A8S3S7V2_MYTED|nr:unnamed protein product [Mytilus edulis]
MMTNNDVHWSKQNNNTFRRVGLQLVVDSVNRLDRGIYVCSVVIQLTPTAGQAVNVTGSTTVELDVLSMLSERSEMCQKWTNCLTKTTLLWTEWPSATTCGSTICDSLSDINPYKVKENTTDLHLTCNVTDANPAAMTYRWYKDGSSLSTGETYEIQTVRRSHTGSYTCDATNTVGISDISSFVELDILYGVSLKLSETEINIKESEKWELSCIGDGNPLPKLACFYSHNSTTVGEQKDNTTFINVEHANCVDTGIYICSGNNTIGESVSKSADIHVSCKYFSRSKAYLVCVLFSQLVDIGKILK